MYFSLSLFWASSIHIANEMFHGAMKHLCGLRYRFVILLSLTACFYGQANEFQPIVVNFDSHQPGEYSKSMIQQDWKNLEWSGLQGRGTIVKTQVPDRGQVLKIDYPKGSVGPGEGGGQFLVSIPPANEYWLTYDIQFNEAFDFRLGGKLPGLTSGGSQYTGGNLPVNGEGWSARYMWKRAGGVMIYLYYVDMPGIWGENITLEAAQFIPGKWHRLTQHIRVNTPDQSDGILEVWFDGKQVLSRDNIRFRIGDKGQIDSFYFSTFHGGNTDQWAPQVDCFALFDHFTIETDVPDYLSESNLSYSEANLHH